MGMLKRRRSDRPHHRRWQTAATDQLGFGRPGRLGAAVATREFLHPASRVDELLLSGEKGMASRTDADTNIPPG
jgi:hypothetical protein